MRDDQMSATATEILENVRALEPRIRQSAETIEAERRLPADLARDLMEAQVFRMGTSRAYGGPELDPMSQVRVVEELARIEGSASRLPPLAAERPIGRCRRDKWGVYAFPQRLAIRQLVILGSNSTQAVHVARRQGRN